MPENRVIFGLKNAHFALITEEEDGIFTYGEPVPIKGSVELTLEPRGERGEFYADDILYYTTVSNQGYNLTLTVANIPLEFKTEVLGETMEDTDNVLTENSNAKPKKIAFMFEFDGDQKAVRHVLYNCSASRPSLSSATKTETAEPRTNEISLVASPRPFDGVVKRSTTAETPDNVYNAWYNAVYDPDTMTA